MGTKTSKSIGGEHHAIVTSGSEEYDKYNFYLRSHGHPGLFTEIELRFSASQLLEESMFNSKINPMTVIYIKNNGKLEEIGRTEPILNTLHPKWVETMKIFFHLERVQTLIFRVYDVHTKYHNVPRKEIKLNDKDLQGQATCALSEILTKQSRSLTLSLKDGHRRSRSQGSLTIQADETVGSKSVIKFVLRCSQLGNQNLLSTSDPFLRIGKIVQVGSSIPIYQTEVIKNDLNPVWNPVSLSIQKFETKDKPLLIQCFDFNSNGKHELIGKVEKSMADLERLCREKTGVNFVIPSSHRGRDKVLQGQLFVHSFAENVESSFLDYIFDGYNLNFMVAVDFSASNGNPKDMNSLHYMDPSGRRLNCYQQAIMEVGEVIRFYDNDCRFPAWGFGARTSDGNISHCFNLSGSPTQLEVEGVEGLMEAYANTVCNVSFIEPTQFGRVILHALETFKGTCTFRKYFVLVIITDGALTDLQETINALVWASESPLSIVIVGVGGGNFSQMKILDGDEGKPLKNSRGCVATDIVQFVSMQKVHDEEICLANVLLEELPEQFLRHVRSSIFNCRTRTSKK